MDTQTLLEDYEQFTSFFQSLSFSEDDSPEPLSLDEILDSLTEEDYS